MSDASRPERPLAGRPGSGAMFDRIAHRYDLLNRILSLGMDQSWRKRTIRALALAPGATVLDLATGTADMALMALRLHPGVTVTGVDPSLRMLAVGREKIAARGLDARIRLEGGDAEALPFADHAFDAVMIAFGIRNVPDRPRALAEMARVTKPGGRVAILELNEPRRGLLAPFARAWVRHAVPRIGAAISGEREYRYLQGSIEVFPDAEAFAATMRGAGLEIVAVEPLGFGACTLFVGTPARARS